MKVRALRGVCIGVDLHLQPGDTADLDPAQVTFLTGIGAVEKVEEPPVPQEPPAEPVAPASAFDSKPEAKPDHKHESKLSHKLGISKKEK